MFKTPPLNQERFLDDSNQEQSSGSNKSHIDNDNDDYKRFQLLTPQTPKDYPKLRRSSLAPLPKPSKNLEFDLSLDTSLSDASFAYLASPSSPLSSSLFNTPVTTKDYDSTVPSSPISITSSIDSTKLYPKSTIFSSIEIQNLVEDSIIDSKFQFDVLSNQVIGKGSYSTVLKCQSGDNTFAIKIPKSLNSSKQIYKELMNFKVISNYLILNDIDINSFPILNVYGIIYLNKFKYNRIRLNEQLPCLISTNLSSNLSNYIKLEKCSKGSNPSNELIIGENLWWKLTKQLIMGLIILKDCQMIHMDLKPSNILIDSKNLDFKIADLTSGGLKSDIEKEFIDKVSNGIFFDVTLQYCSPELINSNCPTCPSFESDLYALGLILLVAATGEEPYSEFLNNKTSSAFIHLNESIKKNKVLDLLSFKSIEILRQNPQVYKLIEMILIQRASLDQVVDYLNHH